MNNLVSEVRVGVTRGERLFFGRPELDAPTPATFDDTDGLSLDIEDPNNPGITNWHVVTTVSSRSGYQYSVDETLNWQTAGARRMTHAEAQRLDRFHTRPDPQRPIGISTTRTIPAAGSGNWRFDSIGNGLRRRG